MRFLKLFVLSAISVMLLAVFLASEAGVARATALTCAWKVMPEAHSLKQPLLNAAVALAPNNVWAVGYGGVPEYPYADIEHWNGKKWKVVPSPNLAPDFYNLTGMAAVSSTDIWAVGYTSYDTNLTLIEHWNGTRWSIVPGPNSGTSDSLSQVAAISTDDVWAVGADQSGTLIEHWNGTTWNIVASPDPGTYSNTLTSVTAITSNDVWAVGYYQNMSSPFQTLIEHWNGT